MIRIYVMCTRRPGYGLQNTTKHNCYDTRDCVIAKCRNYQSVTVRRCIRAIYLRICHFFYRHIFYNCNITQVPTNIIMATNDGNCFRNTDCGGAGKNILCHVIIFRVVIIVIVISYFIVFE